MLLLLARLRAIPYYRARARAHRIYRRPGHEGSWEAEKHLNAVFWRLPEWARKALQARWTRGDAALIALLKDEEN